MLSISSLEVSLEAGGLTLESSLESLKALQRANESGCTRDKKILELALQNYSRPQVVGMGVA